MSQIRGEQPMSFIFLLPLRIPSKTQLRACNFPKSGRLSLGHSEAYLVLENHSIEQSIAY